MVFKKLLCIVWFTSIIVRIQAADSDPLSDAEQQMILERYNGLKEFLVEHQDIANGWKLIWDTNLTKLAGKLATNFEPSHPDTIPNGPNYRVFFTSAKKYSIIGVENDRIKNKPSDESWSELTNRQFSSEKDYEQSGFEAVRMVQRSIGCVHYNFDTENYIFDCLCVVGPYGFDDVSEESHIPGEPASHCGPYGMKENKLCVLIPPPPTTKKPKKNRDDDDYDEDSDDEDSGRRRKKKKKSREDEEEEFDLVLYLDSVRQDQGTFLAVVLVFVILLLE